VPRQLVLFVCLCLVTWLFRRDRQWRRAGSWGLLIPGSWLAIEGSRPLSDWFSPSAGSNVEGNPVNTLFFAVLIVAAVVVLRNRGFNWGRFVRDNKAILAVYLYFCLSVLWSELPLVSLKRLAKDFGAILVGLVVLTESDPEEAVNILVARVSYLLFPLSIVLGKYYPEIGRTYSKSGEPMFAGLAQEKNSLGQTVMVLGLVLMWSLIELHKERDRAQDRSQRRILMGMVLLGGWLLIECDSKTSLVGLLLGTGVLWGSGHLLRLRNGKPVLVCCLAASLCVAVMDKTFNLSEVVIKALGRNPTLTGRTEIWRHVKEQKTNPLIGEGFYVFWDSDKGQAVIDATLEIKSAHNGYLEAYVDGGLVAVVLLVLMLLSCGDRVINRMFAGDSLGKLGLAVWLVAIVYNLSEASFFRLTPLWFVLLLVLVVCPSSNALKESDAV
jgi:exopolysaccharide production protein ExoQ